ncbi:MAG: type II toxin-antitoxin system HicA family toxin [Nitrospirae bacterium]|nr:type II toxin-antitoxin system HicA family toxin [Nitrospirota bacterium]
MGRDILDKVLSGLSDKNIRFDDIKKLIMDFGFACRIKGDHHIFSKEGIAEIIDLQPLKDGKAKAYQVKQVRNLILKYKLHKEGENV